MYQCYIIPVARILDGQRGKLIMAVGASAVVSAPTAVYARGRQEWVDANLRPVRDAITARVASMPASDLRLIIDLGEDGSFVVDMVTRTVSDDVSPPGSAPTVTVSTTPRCMAHLLNGVLEARAALLFGTLKFSDSVGEIVRWIDELLGKRYPRQERGPAPSSHQFSGGVNRNPRRPRGPHEPGRRHRLRYAG